MMAAPKSIRKHIFAILAACLFEAVAYAFIFTSQKNVGTVVLGVLLLPGTALSFFVGGGMSMVDGLTPRWNDDIAVGLGLLLNAALFYGCGLLVVRLGNVMRKAFKAT